MIEILKDVVAPIGAALSALFAGLIWWLARRRLTSRYTLRVESGKSDDTMAFAIEVLNRGDREIVVEAISVKPPLAILTNREDSHYGATITKEHLGAANRVQRVETVRRIEPDKSSGWSVVIARDGGFNSCKRVSIALHILKSFPAIRHKKKVLTTILPPRMRSDKLNSI